VFELTFLPYWGWGDMAVSCWGDMAVGLLQLMCFTNHKYYYF